MSLLHSQVTTYNFSNAASEEKRSGELGLPATSLTQKVGEDTKDFETRVHGLLLDHVMNNCSYLPFDIPANVLSSSSLELLFDKAQAVKDPKTLSDYEYEWENFKPQFDLLLVAVRTTVKDLSKQKSQRESEARKRVEGEEKAKQKKLQEEVAQAMAAQKMLREFQTNSQVFSLPMTPHNAIVQVSVNEWQAATADYDLPFIVTGLSAKVVEALKPAAATAFSTLFGKWELESLQSEQCRASRCVASVIDNDAAVRDAEALLGPFKPPEPWIPKDEALAASLQSISLYASAHNCVSYSRESMGLPSLRCLLGGGGMRVLMGAVPDLVNYLIQIEYVKKGSSVKDQDIANYLCTMSKEEVFAAKNKGLTLWHAELPVRLSTVHSGFPFLWPRVC